MSAVNYPDPDFNSIQYVERFFLKANSIHQDFYNLNNHKGLFIDLTNRSYSIGVVVFTALALFFISKNANKVINLIILTIVDSVLIFHKIETDKSYFFEKKTARMRAQFSNLLISRMQKYHFLDQKLKEEKNLEKVNEAFIKRLSQSYDQEELKIKESKGSIEKWQLFHVQMSQMLLKHKIDGFSLEGIEKIEGKIDADFQKWYERALKVVKLFLYGSHNTAKPYIQFEIKTDASGQKQIITQPWPLSSEDKIYQRSS